jgi:ABC-type glutathione transport system ATPase component
MTDPDIVLEVRDLTIRSRADRGGDPLVQGISFRVHAGETLGIVGESGSGKSLTLRAVAGLLRPGVLLDGGDIDLHGNRVGMVFQEPMTSLNPTMRVWDLITLAPRKRHRWSRARARQEAERLLREVGIPDAEAKAGAWPHQLSGGLRQRVMIAMALANEPEILLCDEPTTAVDVLVQQQILDLLRAVQKNRSLSIVFVSHDLAVIEHLCDRVAVMRDGVLLEQGDVVPMFSDPGHPYSRALIESVPTFDSDKTRELPTVLSVTEGREPSRVPARTGAGVGASVEIRDLCVSYERSRRRRLPHVVQDVTLAIEPGTTLGLVGASGSGKSTVARAVAGLQAPSAGEILVEGRRLESRRSRADARTVQMVFQDPSAALNPMRTVRQTLEELLAVHRLVPAAQRRARARELLDMVELSDRYLDAHAVQLSGGQKQRVGIAKALALEPRVLIADESVAALDVSVQASVLNTLRRLQRELGLTMLFISHDLAVTRYVSDRIAVMHHGRIVEEGDADAIVNSPREDYTMRLLAAARLSPIVTPVT